MNKKKEFKIKLWAANGDFFDGFLNNNELFTIKDQ